MQFTKTIIAMLPAMAFAAPATTAASPNDVIQAYIASADSTIHQLSIFQCQIKACVEALAPLVAACAIAAATEGRDTAKDATCVADAYQDLTPSKKPAECANCYK